MKKVLWKKKTQIADRIYQYLNVINQEKNYFKNYTIFDIFTWHWKADNNKIVIQTKMQRIQKSSHSFESV